MIVAVTIGYKASAEQFGPREIVDLAVTAEEHGFDSVAISDHFQPWRHNGGHAPFSLAWLAAAGERTNKIRLGTSVLTPTFRYNPAVIAQAFATLGVLNPGRIFLGVGSGEALNEIATGYLGRGNHEWPPFKERHARLREAVDLIRQLWAGERVSFDGEYYSTHDATIYDRPELLPKIFIAAGGPVMARTAGRIGDGLICTSGKGDELYTEKLLPAFQKGWDESTAGSPASEPERIIEIKLSYEHTEEAALENTRFWAALSLTAEQKHGTSDPVEMERLADDLPIEQVASRWIVGTNPGQVVSQIQQYIDWGFNHILLHSPGHDQQRFMKLFAEDLAPRLRQ